MQLLITALVHHNVSSGTDAPCKTERTALPMKQVSRNG